jgi:hypothetical protein
MKIKVFLTKLKVENFSVSAGRPERRYRNRQLSPAVGIFPCRIPDTYTGNNISHRDAIRQRNRTSPLTVDWHEGIS